MICSNKFQSFSIISNHFQSFPIISPTFNIPNIHLIASASTNGNSLNYLLSTDKKRSWNKWSRREGLTLTQAGHKEGFRSYTSLQWVQIFSEGTICIKSHAISRFLYVWVCFFNKILCICAFTRFYALPFSQDFLHFRIRKIFLKHSYLYNISIKVSFCHVNG